MGVPIIGITVGDPAGIGPEIAVKAAADPRVTAVCLPQLYGPRSPRTLSMYAVGEVSADAGRAAYDAIVDAVNAAKSGAIDAIATAPINKESFARAGLPWKGHTDLLAHLTDAPQAAMLFHSDALRVVLATIHVPLADVPRLLTRE
ncbi:MAG: 4-hydroxythreonine-4-phosphate dehydrogenase PdxA, partial [Vicinamibacterales bacterium]